MIGAGAWRTGNKRGQKPAGRKISGYGQPVRLQRRVAAGMLLPEKQDCWLYQ